MAITTGGTEQLNVGRLYLMKIYNSLQEVYVEKITKTAFKFRKERADGTWYVDWVEKKEFHQRHAVLEQLDTPLKKPQLEHEKITINDPTHLKNMKDYTKECPICQGDGWIPDDNTTSGRSSCPKCWGSGRVWK
jgi:hypothetical protein